MNPMDSTLPRQAAAEADNAALVQQALAGSEQAFELLMRRHNRRLFRLARSLLRTDADAEDALQEAYLRAFGALAGFHGDSSLGTWLSRIVLNECMSRLRRQSRRDQLVLIVSSDAQEQEEGNVMASPDNDNPDHALARAQMRRLLESKLDALPEDFRTVFMLRSVEELSVEETAACLGISDATVRTRHFRARSMLRESLAQEIDMAERDVFSFDGARCDRIVAAVLGRLRAQ